MRIVICWAEISGYMAACWRALSAYDDVDLRVIAFRSGVSHAFADSTVAGLDCRLLGPEEKSDAKLIRSLVIEHRPDAIINVGWFHEPYNRLALDPALASARVYLTMDTPRKDTLRQYLARIKLRRLLRRASGVMVAGERSWQYARFLGVGEEGIFRGNYAYDQDLYNRSLLEKRLALPTGWPRRLLFVGRYVPEKGLDVLMEAYARYRRSATSPWGLTCCGRGPLGGLLAGREGVEDRGFTQPADLPAIFAEHGALVLPSRYEPWGVVVAEALASGMPVVCSEACGASVELVRPHYNGMLCAAGSVDSLCRAMLWLDAQGERAREMGEAGVPLAEAFTARMWARRWRWALFGGQ